MQQVLLEVLQHRTYLAIPRAMRHILNHFNWKSPCPENYIYNHLILTGGKSGMRPWREQSASQQFVRHVESLSLVNTLCTSHVTQKTAEQQFQSSAPGLLARWFIFGVFPVLLFLYPLFLFRLFVRSITHSFSQCLIQSVTLSLSLNSFTPEFKKYVLPTF